MPLAFSTVCDHWLSDTIERPSFSMRLSDEGIPIKDVLSADLAEPGTFATLKLPADNVSASCVAQEFGFKHIETALTFCGNVSISGRGSNRARFAMDQDKAAVMEIAQTSFVYSRFHKDPVFPQALAHKLKAAWAGNYFERKRGDAMIVVEEDKHVRGFLLALKGADNSLIIDLIAVARSSERRGLGREMMEFAQQHGVGEGVPAAFVVGTQACNTASIKMYESAGFRFSHAQNVLHFHGNTDGVALGETGS